jgi:hypothetical protein
MVSEICELIAIVTDWVAPSVTFTEETARIASKFGKG